VARRKALIVGIDTLAGSNLGLDWADRCEVIGTACRRRFALDGCRIIAVTSVDHGLLAEIIETECPQSIVYCGEISNSAWDWPQDVDLATESQRLTAVCRAAKCCGSRVIVVSSDAACSGHYLFSRENYAGVDPTAITVREIEQASAVDALIVRTHLFGWSPTANCWAERIWTAIDESRMVQASAARYATPVLATDFAHLLWKAQSQGLSGIHNLAGAERASMWQFAMALARAAGLPLRTMRLDPALVGVDPGLRNQARFSQETSLDSRRLQSVLQTPLPRLQESIERFFEQAASGHRQRIAASLVAPTLTSAA